MRHTFKRRAWWSLSALLLINLTVLANQSPAGNPLPPAYIKSASWTNALPWKRVVTANEIAGLIDQKNYVDSAVLSTTLESLSAKGGGVLYFGSGTYYFTTDLPLPSNVILRGEAPAGNSNELFTKLVFPRLYLARSEAPKSNEPHDIVTKRIYYAGAPDAFTGLVNLDINRATISLGGASQDKAVRSVIIYGVRSNNAAQLDPQIPTATQASSRQGWQVWPDKSVANINIGFSGNCLVAKSTLNDQVTDNLAQHDYMTDDGMRFDGSRAEFRFTHHPGISVWSAPAAKKHAALVADNTIHTSTGYAAIVGLDEAAQGNQVAVISERSNQVNDGRSAAAAGYNLLFKDEIRSETGLFVNEFNDSLHYRLIKPFNYDPAKTYPLVVFLHDFWEKGSDNKRHLRQFVWQFLTEENRTQYPCFIVAPQLPMSEPKWKTDGLGSETWPIQCNSMLITELASRFPIDNKRVYAVGNSMGGAGALNLAIQHPDQIAAVVGISVFYRLTKNSSLQVSKIPIWLIYGEKDDRIEPVVRQSIRTDLRGANAIFKYTEISGMGHRCWNNIVEEVPGFMSWLFAQHK